MPVRVLVTLFKVVAVAEAVSWAGLLVGMYLEHVAGTTDLGVRVFGPVHGGLFLAYVGLTLVVATRLRWGVRTTLVGLACSVPPFATLVFELWAARSGRLRHPDPAPGPGLEDARYADRRPVG
jgi:integral membrane protein